MIHSTVLEAFEGPSQEIPTPIGINLPPSFVGFNPVATATAAFPYVFDANAEDPEGDELTYYLVIAPEGMDIIRSTGFVYWTPGADQASSTPHTVIIGVTDGINFAHESFLVTVLPAVEPLPVAPAKPQKKEQKPVQASTPKEEPEKKPSALEGITIEDIVKEEPVLEYAQEDTASVLLSGFARYVKFIAWLGERIGMVLLGLAVIIILSAWILYPRKTDWKKVEDSIPSVSDLPSRDAGIPKEASYLLPGAKNKNEEKE